MHRGYHAIWRKFYDEHPFWTEKRVFSKAEAWIDIIKEAQFTAKPKQVLFGSKILTQNYGEILRSTRCWGRRWGWAEKRTHRFFQLLKNMEQIDTVNETVTTRLIVLNYEQYDIRRHGERHGEETDATHVRHTSDRQLKSVKSVKNDKSKDSTLTGTVSETQKKLPNCPYKKITSLYHETLPDLPAIPELTEDLKKTIRARWKEHPDLDWWSWYFNGINECDFLMGRVKDFKAHLSWLVGPKNMTKVLSGQYLNHGRRSTGCSITDKNLQAAKEFVDDESIG